MLAEFHLHHMEPERLHLPRKRLQESVGNARSAAFGKRALYAPQVGKEIGGRTVHAVCVSLHRLVKAACHDRKDGAVRFALPDAGRVRRQGFAHFQLAAPEVAQLGGRRRGVRVLGQAACEPVRLRGERAHHMVGELARNGAADGCGDVRVAVAVRSDPAAGMDERRAYRRDRAAFRAEQPVVETAIDLRNSTEERVVENVDDRVRFLYRSRLVRCDERCAE